MDVIFICRIAILTAHNNEQTDTLFVLVSHLFYPDMFHADVDELSQKQKNMGLYFYFHAAFLV